MEIIYRRNHPPPSNLEQQPQRKEQRRRRQRRQQVVVTLSRKVPTTQPVTTMTLMQLYHQHPIIMITFMKATKIIMILLSKPPKDALLHHRKTTCHRHQSIRRFRRFIRLPQTTININITNSSPLWNLEPRIFAVERMNGKRKYLVGQFGRVADWYWRKQSVGTRHLYEVIREETPCRLYFDLEFSKLYNPDLVTCEETTKLLYEFYEELKYDIQQYYGLQLQSKQIINLDSSNESKFSRHWIIRLVVDNKKKEKGKQENDNNNKEADDEVLFEDAPTVGTVR